MITDADFQHDSLIAFKSTGRQETKRSSTDGSAAGPRANFSLPEALNTLWEKLWVKVVAVILIGFVQARDIMLIQVPNLQVQSNEMLGVLIGHPTWRVFQNRLLGPYLIKILEHVTHRPFDRCYLQAADCLIILSSLIFFFLGRKYFKSDTRALQATAVFAVLTVLVQDARFLYTWDCIDLCTMTAFAFLIFMRANPALFVLVFVAELFNRESASYIGIWLILLGIGLTRSATGSFTVKPKPSLLALGIALVLVCRLVTHYLRMHLFISGIGVGAHDPINNIDKEHFQLWLNLKGFAHTGPMQMMPLILFMIWPFAVWKAKPLMGDQYLSYVTLNALMAASLLTVALVGQQRVWLVELPFMLIPLAATSFGMGRELRPESLQIESSERELALAEV